MLGWIKFSSWFEIRMFSYSSNEVKLLFTWPFKRITYSTLDYSWTLGFYAAFFYVYKSYCFKCGVLTTEDYIISGYK